MRHAPAIAPTPFALSLAAIALAALAATACLSASPAIADDTATDPPRVVVELFTSQGCSSCPPADRVLSDLADDPAVIALAFHVDYWNDLGWEDPFSAAGWSERQRAYARLHGESRVYTPQLVVQGTEHTVGSVRPQVDRLIADATPLAAHPDLELAGRSDERTRTATVRFDDDERAACADGFAYVVVTESGLVTEVDAGENDDETLTNDAIVRSLVLLGQVGDESDAEMAVELELDAAWDADNLAVVAVVQDLESGRFLCASSRQSW